MSAVFVRLLVVTFLCGAVRSAWGQSPQRTQIGVGTHFASEPGLDMIAAAKIEFVREDIRWESLEKQKGKLVMHPNYERYVTATLKRGIKPLLILDYGNPFYDGGGYPRSKEAIAGYARFCKFVATYFRGRVDQFEVWNEWNWGTGMKPDPATGHVERGKPEDYVALLKEAYKAIKAANPKAVVLGGGMAGNGLQDGWLDNACTKGMLGSLDGLSFHPYCWGAAGNDKKPDYGTVGMIRQVEDCLAKYPGGKTTPFYISEFGWPNLPGGNGTSKRDSADYVSRSILLAAIMPRVKGVWWYDWKDDGQDPNQPYDWSGLVNYDVTPKPAYFAVKNTISFLRAAKTKPVLMTTDNIRCLLFRDSAGLIHAAGWTLSGRGRLRLHGEAKLAGTKVQVCSAIEGETQAVWTADPSGNGSWIEVNVDATPALIIPVR